jgi:hypothetical protein
MQSAAEKCSPMSEPRIGVYLIFIGVNGTGKSTVIRALMRHNPRNIVVPANAEDSLKAWADLPELPVWQVMERVTGFKKYEAEELEARTNRGKRHDFFRAMRRLYNAVNRSYKITMPVAANVVYSSLINEEFGFTNGGLITDDLVKRIPEANPRAEVMQLLSDRRHKALDLIFSAHSPTQIPPKLMDNGPQLFLFKTATNFTRSEEKYPEAVFQNLLSAQKRVNAHPSRYFFEKIQMPYME